MIITMYRTASYASYKCNEEKNPIEKAKLNKIVTDFNEGEISYGGDPEKAYSILKSN